MKTNRIANSMTAIAILSLAATPALADPASQLRSLNGQSAANAERVLHDRGFKHISSHATAMGFTNSYWWDKDDRSCVVVEERRGTVSTVNDSPASDCGHTEDGSGGVVAAVAGAAILGALLTHKSDHHDDGQHLSDAEAEQHYHRGFKDGLHNAAYHNWDNSSDYSDGYSAGVEQRKANLRHHTGRGGNHAAVGFGDLHGARAAGAMDAMQNRGFRQVDNFTSGNTRYSIQYRAASRQCVQMTIADGHIYDIRDIGQHPNCR